MQLEIDVLDVGNADAIIVRMSYLGFDDVTLIDGGHAKDAQLILDHVRAHTSRGTVDRVICTHTDQDHVGGLFEVIEELRPAVVFVHDPRLLLARQRVLLEGRQRTDQIKAVMEGLEMGADFVRHLERAGIRHLSPVAGSVIPLSPLFALNADWVVHGPTAAFYNSTLEQATTPPNQFLQALLGSARSPHPAEVTALLELLAKEGLGGEDDTSAINQTSVISELRVNGKRYLFTGDAGQQAFNSVLASGVDLRGLDWIQVPHHGSRRNLSHDLIGLFSPRVAYISAAGTDEKHPSSLTIDALAKQGTLVYSTHRSGSLMHSNPQLGRGGYTTATPLKMPRGLPAGLFAPLT